MYPNMLIFILKIQHIVPYLDYTGYPTNMEDAFRRAKDYEESLNNITTKQSHLSSFVTTMSSTDPVRSFTNSNTGET